MTEVEIAAVIRDHRFRFADEDGLQSALAAVLAAAGHTVQREVRLSARDRIDLLVGRIGIEVKVKGSGSEAARQLARYAKSDVVDALLLVTTRAGHLSVPREIGGKPVTVVRLLPGI